MMKLTPPSLITPNRDLTPVTSIQQSARVRKPSKRAHESEAVGKELKEERTSKKAKAKVKQAQKKKESTAKAKLTKFCPARLRWLGYLALGYSLHWRHLVRVSRLRGLAPKLRHPTQRV
jgi:hypothetical protein